MQKVAQNSDHYQRSTTSRFGVGWDSQIILREYYRYTIDLSLLYTMKHIEY